MLLVIIIDVLVVAILANTALTKGLERALPFLAFVIAFFPEESLVPIPGLFGLSTRRLAVAVLVVLYFVTKRPSHDGPPPQALPLKYIMGIQVLWVTISTLLSVVPVVSIKQMLSQVVEYYLLYFVLVRTITRTETIDKILKAMVVAVFIASIFGSYEAYTGVSVLRYFPAAEHRFGTPGEEADIGRGIRVVSTFDNPSLFGTGLAFAIVEAFYLLTRAKRSKEKLFLWLAIILMFLNIYKTTSRGPWLALIMGFVLLAYFANSATRKRMFAIAVLTAAVLIVRPGVRDEITSIFSATVTQDTNSGLANSYQYRYVLIDVGKKALADKPMRELWGYGLESWFYLDLTGPFLNNPHYHFLSGDNAYVVAMVETGYAGLLLLVMLFLIAAYRTLKTFWSIPRPYNAICGIMFINIIQYLFMMTNIGMYGWGQTGHMLWTCIAIAMVYKAVYEAETAASASPEALLTDSAPQDLQGSFA